MNKVDTGRTHLLDNDLCVNNVGNNRYDLVLIASHRSKEIRRANKESNKFEHLHTNVTALLEVQSGKIGREYLKRVR
jgi:DNA-directed RNA polymerase subunit K/omega